MFDRIVNRYNLYERNLYKYFRKNLVGGTPGKWMAVFLTALNRNFIHKLYFNYLEVPITTKCSLRCKECSNLIQYYQKGKCFDYKKIISDVSRLSQVTEKIEMLRILGGEPLIHPFLKEIIEGLLRNKNIKNIQIVTNGTILFRENVIPILRNDRVSVDISNYGSVSRNYGGLIKQLKSNEIKFYTSKALYWTEQGSFRYENRSTKELKCVLKQCKLDCISVFDGNIHLCPRSSNGWDLNIFKADEQDFVNIRKCITKTELRKKIYRLLNCKSIVACNYCNVFRSDELKSCIAGEQISKEQALNRFNKIISENGGKIHEANCMGGGKRIRRP